MFGAGAEHLLGDNGVEWFINRRIEAVPRSDSVVKVSTKEAIRLKREGCWPNGAVVECPRSQNAPHLRGPLGLESASSLLEALLPPEPQFKAVLFAECPMGTADWARASLDYLKGASVAAKATAPRQNEP